MGFWFRIILLMIFPVLVYGQGKENAVDRIKTAKGLRTFVKKQVLIAKYQAPWLHLRDLKPLWSFNNINLKDNSNSESIRKLLKENNASPWVKGDFNGDGYTDLIITDEDPSLVLGIISNAGSDSFSIKPVSSTSFSDLVLVFFERFGDRDGLRLHTYNFFRHPQLVKEMLIYTYGAFMDYMPNPDQLKVSSLAAQATPCYGRCPVFEMILSELELSFRLILLNDHRGLRSRRCSQGAWYLAIRTCFLTKVRSPFAVFILSTAFSFPCPYTKTGKIINSIMRNQKPIVQRNGTAIQKV